MHVNARFAMFAEVGAAYDFDPTTSPKKSGKTPVKQENDGGIYRQDHVNREGMYVVGADSRRAEIVWWL